MASALLEKLLPKLEAADSTLPSLTRARIVFTEDKRRLLEDGDFFVAAERRIDFSVPMQKVQPVARPEAPALDEDRANILRRELHRARRSRNAPASGLLEAALSAMGQLTPPTVQQQAEVSDAVTRPDDTTSTIFRQGVAGQQGDEDCPATGAATTTTSNNDKPVAFPDDTTSTIFRQGVAGQQDVEDCPATGAATTITSNTDIPAAFPDDATSTIFRHGVAGPHEGNDEDVALVARVADEDTDDV
jgi:hypothetical protein